MAIIAYDPKTQTKYGLEYENVAGREQAAKAGLQLTTGDITGLPQYGVAPVAPVTPVTTVTNPLSSVGNEMANGGTMNTAYYDNLLNKYNDFYTQQQTATTERQNALKAEEERRIAEVNRLFGQEETQLKQQQDESKKTQDVIAFRLGQDATPYAKAEMDKLITKQNYEQSQLQQRKQEAVDKIRSAIADENFRLAEQLRTSYKDMLDEEQNLRSKQQEEYTSQVNMAMKQQEFSYEQKQRDFNLQSDKADALASGLVDVDETGKIIEPTPDELKQYAEDRGIDVDILTSSVNERIDALKKVERENRGKTSYYDEKGAGNTTIRHYFNELTGEELYKKNLGQTYKPIGGGGGSGTTQNKQKAITAMTDKLSSVAGGDGFVSPDDYLTARNAWVSEGFTPTEFDTKFKGFRNPNNPNYNISKEKQTSEEQFLNKDYFLKNYTKDQLKQSAKDAGFASIFDLAGTEIDKYLDSVMKSIEAYREAGYTDKQILLEMK